LIECAISVILIATFETFSLLNPALRIPQQLLCWDTLTAFAVLVGLRFTVLKWQPVGVHFPNVQKKKDWMKNETNGKI